MPPLTAAPNGTYVKVRSTRPPREAILRPTGPTTAEVELLAPEDGVSAGQACVFYAPEGSRILGGGWIWRTGPVKSITLALALALPLPALAETREERVAAAQVYIDMALADFDMEAMIGMLYQPILDQVTAGGAALTEDQLARIKALYLGAFAEPPPALMRDQAGIMADMFTLAEIMALNDSTPRPKASRSWQNCRN